jgi:hypothetical protein
MTIIIYAVCIYTLIGFFVGHVLVNINNDQHQKFNARNVIITSTFLWPIFAYAFLLGVIQGIKQGINNYNNKK